MVTTTDIYLFLNFKIARYLFNSKLAFLGKALHHILVFFWNCDIDVNAKFGKNIKFPHFIGIVIGPCEIGDKCIIRQNVVIGRKNVDSIKYPKICDGVEIGANSVIIGDITIGRKSIVGALSLINKNIPENTIAYNEKILKIIKNE